MTARAVRLLTAALVLGAFVWPHTVGVPGVWAASAAGPGAAPAAEFVAPSRRNMQEPVYPRSRQAQGREGWVQLNFMIDPKGNPYEVAVTDSTGDELFERSAVRAVERSSFAPATLGGRPIDAAYNLKIKFSLVGGSPGARDAFIADYRALSDAIERADQQAASEMLERIDVQNLYEDAFFNLARYNYLVRWGQPRQQREALSRAVAHEQEDDYLPQDVFVWALRSLLSLQVRAQDYGGALETWRTLRDQPLDREVRARLERAVRDIEELRADDRAFAVEGTLGKDTSWFFRLLKNRFRIDRVTGDVTALKLRCERKYVLFDHQPDVIYTISDNYGDCRLEIVGDPGTTFRLIQS